VLHADKLEKVNNIFLNTLSVLRKTTRF